MTALHNHHIGLCGGCRPPSFCWRVIGLCSHLSFDVEKGAANLWTGSLRPGSLRIQDGSAVRDTQRRYAWEMVCDGWW